MHTHLSEQPGMHNPPASIFHYYNAISWRQGWAMLRCSCTDAECVRWAVIDTRPQTWVGAKKYRKDPAGSRKGAANSVVWYTHPALELSCVLYRHKYTHDTHSNTHKTGLWLCIWMQSCFYETITLKRMNLQFRCKQFSKVHSWDQLTSCTMSCPV